MVDFPVHDESGWVCPVCGAVRQHRFGMHRPITNPSIRTCGGKPVPAYLLDLAKELLAARWRLWIKKVSYLEAGGNPTSSSAYGIWQCL